jgi:hypothetical protein
MTQRTSHVRTRFGWIVALVVLAVAIFVPGAAQAQDRNCRDFSTQAEAQAVLNQDRSDPNNLDSDNDGIACEDLPGGTAAQTSVITQADCNAGRITRHGRTLRGAECTRLIGQRVNLAGTGFEAWIFGLGGGVCLLAGLGLRRRRPQAAAIA